MPRLRPTRLFAASLVTVTGCGVLTSEPIDASLPPDEEWVNCFEDPYHYDCNPPPPDAFVPDAMPFACLEGPGDVCEECLPHGARNAWDSPCIAAVCAVDAACCASTWDERCIDLADARCPSVRCADSVGLGGLGIFVEITWNGAALTGTVHAPFGIGHVFSVSWSGAHLASVDRGEQGTFPSTYWPTATPIYGRRARWADLSGDGLPDRVRSGGRGAFYFDGTGTPAIAQWADGYIGDFALHDLDADGDLDALIAFVDGQGLQTYRHDTWFTREPKPIGPDAHGLEICELDGDGARDLLIVQDDRLSAVALVEGAGLGDPVFPDLVTAFRNATCGDLDGDGRDEIVATQDAGPVVVFDGAGLVLWTGAETLAGSGVDTGDLDGDGDVDLVVSEWGADARLHVYWNRAEPALAFDHLQTDPLGTDLGRLDLTYLGPD